MYLEKINDLDNQLESLEEKRRLLLILVFFEQTQLLLGRLNAESAYLYAIQRNNLEYKKICIGYTLGDEKKFGILSELLDDFMPKKWYSIISYLFLTENDDDENQFTSSTSMGDLFDMYVCKEYQRIYSKEKMEHSLLSKTEKIPSQKI